MMNGIMWSVGGMSEIKQVWGIIKDYQCADLKMVQNPALAVWQHQQAKIDELQLKNAELARIMLDKNCEIVKQAMQIDELQKRIDDALRICNTSSFPLITWIDRALRGEHE